MPDVPRFPLRGDFVLQSRRIGSRLLQGLYLKLIQPSVSKIPERGRARRVGAIGYHKGTSKIRNSSALNRLSKVLISQSDFELNTDNPVYPKLDCSMGTGSEPSDRTQIPDLLASVRASPKNVLNRRSPTGVCLSRERQVCGMGGSRVGSEIRKVAFYMIFLMSLRYYLDCSQTARPV